MGPESPAVDPADLRAFVGGFQPEDDSLSAARATALRLGSVPTSPGTGAVLRFLTSVLRAKAVVEVGTGLGVSGLYLLRGMAPDGVLTSIDLDPEHQRLAKRTFTAAGIAPGRTRLIMGRALDVLPRLTDGGYDLLFVDGSKPEYPEYHEQGVRLLRPGGVLAFADVLWEGRIASAAHRDPDTLGVREAAKAIREDPRLVPLLLPVGEGLLVAAKA
ncbi:O-methyltransferase [Actinokineospora bangkokensis]|uniref:Methyltransferase n=1 Tax=Actinokineospora bangkokensis TaxID=1193682 RepID=A0A1Q9LDJ8_9PSEU|nr:O-methyltransferase [Actinokineospora bangkokensis]OLR90111.1 methyltransferase [Actinokineospora bangkokensis]